MKSLSTPRGVLAISESRADLEKIRDAWPEPNDRLHINDVEIRDKKNSRRRGRQDD